MSENQKTYSVKEVANILGVSEKTVRKRIKLGKIKAEIVNGPYGDQYMIAADQFNAAEEVFDVVSVKKEYDLQELSFALKNYLEEERTTILSELEELKKMNLDLIDRLDQILEGQTKKEPLFKKWFKK